MASVAKLWRAFTLPSSDLLMEMAWVAFSCLISVLAGGDEVGPLLLPCLLYVAY